MNKLGTIAAVSMAVLSLLSLAGCQSTQKEVASAPVINGNWASANNLYTANFNNGRFVATANDTGGILSEGNYVLLTENTVQINWFGKASGSNNTANCTKNGEARLDCTDKNGRTFSLIRATSTS